MRIMITTLVALACIPLTSTAAPVADEDYASPFAYEDPKPQRYKLSTRASQIDPRVKAHPEINFLLEKDGRPKDGMNAAVDTRVKPRGKLVISLAGGGMLERACGFGMHGITVPYANGWFDRVKGGDPKDTWRGDVRLEAATGEDVSKLVDIPKPDGLMERAYQLVKWLAKTNPQGNWRYFLTADEAALRWEDVIVVGHSHGSTTAARFAQHVKLDRVVCLSGPRDQDQSWQAAPSVTPPNRYFGFSHVLDGGWVGRHYCRSWELLGMHRYGPIVDVEKVGPPFDNSRRLVTSFAVKGSMIHHNGTAPNDFAMRTAEGKLAHEAVWRYLLTHPVDRVGAETPLDEDCQTDAKKNKQN